MPFLDPTPKRKDGSRKGDDLKNITLSIDHVNRMLPYVSDVCRDLAGDWNELTRVRERLESLTNLSAPTREQSRSIRQLKEENGELIDKINGYVIELAELGGRVEDCSRGIVDFPTFIHGRKVFVCWKLGEKTAAHWHELDETASDRILIGNLNDFLRD